MQRAIPQKVNELTFMMRRANLFFALLLFTKVILFSNPRESHRLAWSRSAGSAKGMYNVMAAVKVWTECFGKRDVSFLKLTTLNPTSK